MADEKPKLHTVYSPTGKEQKVNDHALANLPKGWSKTKPKAKK
jgi:hypothetical protein